ncbi:hypothetical protein OESDEN_12049 [Oesophagostomum dentatum]|uniref:Uncharacterized protein n=1 Tax=Oesophagostomum dentatum TaxID=61180 RepID=A0A0B1SWB1_OESDE|nr:hypothetical protein OESDEN_12049 [Oesophagostomum dentatum]
MWYPIKLARSCPGCTGSYWVNGRRRESVRVMRAKRQLPPYSTPVPWEPSWPKLDRQQRPWWHHHEEWPKYQAPRWDFHGNTLNPHFQDPWVPPENRFQQKWMDICYSLSLQSKEFSEVPCSQLPGELKDRNTELRGYICLKRENGA